MQLSNDPSPGYNIEQMALRYLTYFLHSLILWSLWMQFCLLMNFIFNLQFYQSVSVFKYCRHRWFDKRIVLIVCGCHGHKLWLMTLIILQCLLFQRWKISDDAIYSERDGCIVLWHPVTSGRTYWFYISATTCMYICCGTLHHLLGWCIKKWNVRASCKYLVMDMFWKHVENRSGRTVSEVISFSEDWSCWIP